MPISIPVAISILVLLAYIFDLTAGKTRIPAVILLLALGWGVRELLLFLPAITFPKLEGLLPVLGEIGLVLIVLEGALELEINKEKKPVLIKAALSALIPMLVLTGIAAGAISWLTGAPAVISLLNAVPLCIISSSLAIAVAQNLIPSAKEFVIYESSLSDILGVILFNFFISGKPVHGQLFLEFGYQTVLMLVISFVASALLAILIKQISHKVKFIPIILIVLIIYNLSHQFHLPSLIFILIFGVLLNNLDELRKLRFIRWLQPSLLEAEISRFRELVTELTFLARSAFFILFGFLINITDLVNLRELSIALAFLAVVYGLRWVQLKVARLPLRPLLYIAPRGLISILLVLSIPQNLRLPFLTNSLLLQIIVCSSVIMMLGNIFWPALAENSDEEDSSLKSEGVIPTGPLPESSSTPIGS